MTAEIRIGTSGWYYKHWREKFYEADIAPADMLSFYVQHFNTVEINNTFYALPSLKTAQNWKEKTPANFLFAVKGSRFLTHLKRLLDTKEGLDKFMAVVETLGPKAGPVLFQLPPRWKANPERLENFVQALPSNHGPYVFEFRDPSWFCREIYNILRRNNIALCITNRNNEDSAVEITADFTYIRFHGGDPATRGNYTSETLQRWTKMLNGWRSELKKIYIYFNNDWEGYAIENAFQLRQLLGV